MLEDDDHYNAVRKERFRPTFSPVKYVTVVSDGLHPHPYKPHTHTHHKRPCGGAADHSCVRGVYNGTLSWCESGRVGLVFAE